MNSCWFEKHPIEDLAEDKSTLMSQLRATKWSSKMQFYRQVRDPISVHDLVKDMKDNHLVWLNNESFIVLKKLPKTVPGDSTFRQANMSLDFTRKAVYIYGASEEAVTRVTELFLCLKDEWADKVRVGARYSLFDGPRVPTTFITTRFLSKYIEANPQRQLVLSRSCYLLTDESVALASHPDPLYVGLECKYVDGGYAFCETLAQRTSDFGILSLTTRTFDSMFSMYLRGGYPSHSEGMSAFSKVSIEANSDMFHSSVCLRPLSYHARRIEYTVLNRGGFDDIEPFTIVPRAVTLVFANWLPSRFHTLFLEASGTLSEMGLIYDILHPPSVVQQMELLKAIATSENLHRLELGCLSILDTFWEELLEVITSHKNLRTVVFWARDEFNPVLVLDLISLMKENIHLDILFKCRGSTKCHITVNKMEDMIKPVRLQNRIKALTCESAHDRVALFGATLTKWTGGGFVKTALLLGENADLLCSLMGQPVSLAHQRRRVRQADSRSSPERKVQKTS